jgi:hypothetical protein
MGSDFLHNTFYSSGITSIPVDFIPAGYTSGQYFLYQTFTECNSLTSVNLDFIKNVTVGNTHFLMRMLSKCTGLTDVYMPYINTNGKANAFNGTFNTITGPINLYISGGGTSDVLAVTSSAGLTNAKVTAIYLDNADLVTAYQGSSNWSAIDDSKFLVRP